MKILHRYVLKEHVGPLLFALSALTSLLLLNYIAKQFGNLVGKGLGASVIGEFFVLSIPFTIAMTLPMAVLVSVLYAFSRLAAENEITAMKASGVGMPSVMVPVLLAAASVSAFMIFFNDQVLPRANHRLRVLQGDIARTKPTFALREQVINEVSPGKLSLRAGHLDESSNRMREVTIFDLGDATRRRTIHADSGTLGMGRDGRSLDLILYDGYIQELPRTSPGQLQRTYFESNTVKVKDVFDNFQKTGEGQDSFKSDREMSICDMQREVRQATQDAATAREELRRTLVAAARRAATGVQPAAELPPTPGEGRSLAAAYCRLTSAFGVKTAEAAEPQEGARPRTAEPAFNPALPAIAGDSLGALRQRADSVRAMTERLSAGPAPSSGLGADPALAALRNTGGLNAALASIEGVQARLEDDRRTSNMYAVEIEKKFALSVACVVFVLLGAPVALRFPRGGVGLVIGVSLGVFALYYVGLIGGEELADRGILSPFWAMWATNVLFTLVGVVLMARMGKEGATARGGDVGEAIENLKGWFRKRLRRARPVAAAGGTP